MAYVEAITAQAGLNIKSCRWDDGIDMEVGSNKPTFGNHYFCNLYICLQLKATENWEIGSDGAIAYRVKRSNYEQLRKNCFPPKYLVLYTLPHSRAHWLVHRSHHTDFNNAAFFLSLARSPALRAAANGKIRESRTVEVPTANRLTAVSLLRLYREACEKTLTFTGAG